MANKNFQVELCEAYDRTCNSYQCRNEAIYRLNFNYNAPNGTCIVLCQECFDEMYNTLKLSETTIDLPEQDEIFKTKESLMKSIERAIDDGHEIVIKPRHTEQGDK